MSNTSTNAETAFEIAMSEQQKNITSSSRTPIIRKQDFAGDSTFMKYKKNSIF